jgi:single-strand DNA-binding protein
MASYNRIILMGNLTRDPQMSYLPSQTAVVEFGLAVNHRWRSQDGQQREKVCFIDCQCFGKQAETLHQYVVKGNPILIEGRLDFDTWEGKDGTKRSKHRVFVERFQFLGGGQQRAPGAGQAPAQPRAAAAPAPHPAAAAPQPSAPAPREEYVSEPPPPDNFDEPPAGENIPF